MSPAPWRGRPVVYRCYDADGVLLYIGSSRDVEKRMETHVRTSFWRTYVAKVRIQIAPDVFTARRIEADAIRSENPRFNIHHRMPRALWSEQDFLDVISALRKGASSHSLVTRKRITQLQRELAYRTEGLA